MVLSPATVLVIPARLASTRLPRKVLLDVAGLPMVVRTARQAMATGLPLWIATDSEEVAAVCREHRLEVVMTSSSHPSGSDRIAEAARELGLPAQTVIVNVQADEPLIEPALITALATSVSPRTPVATAAHPIHHVAEVFNPNVVKVVRSKEGNALYFSRAPIPWARDLWQGQPQSERTLSGLSTEVLRHYGVYAFTMQALQQFVALPPSSLEKIEALEQLRFLENGIPIAVEIFKGGVIVGVDTEEDLDRVNAYIRQGLIPR